MNVKELPNRFAISTFNSPRIAFITLVAYVNMILVQFSSAIANDITAIEIVVEGKKLRGVLVQNYSNQDDTQVRHALASHLKPVENTHETQQKSLFSSGKNSVQEWAYKGLSTVSGVARAINIGLHDQYFLTEAANASISAALLNPDSIEFLTVLWASYLAAEAAKSGIGLARQFIGQQYQRWVGQSPIQDDLLTQNTDAVQVGSINAKNIFKAIVAAGLMVTPAEAISATNLNQNINYTTNESAVFFLPIVISDAYNDICQAYFYLEEYPSAGILQSNGTSTVSPTFRYGQWMAAANCTEQVQPLVKWLAYIPAQGYANSPVRIFNSIADGLGYISGQINIFHVNPPPTPIPTPSVTPTTLPPTAPPTPSVTLTTMQPSSSPTPSGAPPTSVSPTSIPPTVAPTSSSFTPSPTPYIPTSFDPKPLIITVAVGAFLAIVGCIFYFCCCGKNKKKDKKREYKEVGNDTQEATEATDLLS